MNNNNPQIEHCFYEAKGQDSDQTCALTREHIDFALPLWHREGYCYGCMHLCVQLWLTKRRSSTPPFVVSPALSLRWRIPPQYYILVRQCFLSVYYKPDSAKITVRTDEKQKLYTLKGPRRQNTSSVHLKRLLCPDNNDINFTANSKGIIRILKKTE